MRILVRATGGFLLVLAALTVFAAFWGDAITTWWYGPPPSDEQVRRDFAQTLDVRSSQQLAQIDIRKIGIGKYEGSWIRMHALFDAAATIDATVSVGGKSVHLKGNDTLIGGELSLEYRRDASGGWELESVTLDRHPMAK